MGRPIPQKIVPDDAIKKGCLESKSIDSFFSGNHFSEITLISLMNDLTAPHDSCLNFMTLEAKIYYLPTYMIASIEYYELSDTIPANLLYLFGLELLSVDFCSPMRKNLPFDLLNELTSKERSAVIEFFIYMYSYHPELYSIDNNYETAQKALVALIKFWSQESFQNSKR